MASKPIDYYAVLEVSPSATPEQIRTAYKKAALRWHPDRVSTDSPERATRTKKFQQINDAYFTLSDATRRHDYDAARQWGTEDATSDWAEDDSADPPPKKGWFGGFPFGGGSSSSSQPKDDAFNTQWSSVFEEMMRDTEMAEDKEEDGKRKTTPTGRFWTAIGMVSGFGMGFIVANVMGGIAGAGAGAKLGSIRDTHGKSVYQVFSELPQADKAKILTELASKLFAQAIS